VVTGLREYPWETYRHLAGWEEFLEMAGATCFLLVFLRQATTLKRYSEVEFK